MIRFHSRKMYKFIYKQISPKSDYFGYFSLRTCLYFCIVFICGIATSAYYDVKEVIRPSLFSPGHDFKKPNFWRVWSQISLEVFIHFRQDIYHSNRLVKANFWKKNGDYVICTLTSYWSCIRERDVLWTWDCHVCHGSRSFTKVVVSWGSHSQ